MCRVVCRKLQSSQGGFGSRIQKGEEQINSDINKIGEQLATIELVKRKNKGSCVDQIECKGEESCSFHKRKYCVEEESSYIRREERAV